MGIEIDFSRGQWSEEEINRLVEEGCGISKEDATGGKHFQFYVVGKDTLVKAQKEPEAHRDLLVRVAGYNAYFVQLSEEMQNEIIGRTEHELGI